MWYLLGIFVIALGVLISFNFKNINKNNVESSEQNIIVINQADTIKPVYSKKDIENKLMVLSETAPPEDLSFGAKCYSQAHPPETASYNCPACGKKTLHKVKGKFKDYDKMKLIQWGISACRNEMKNVKGINIKLDESQFCKNCSPEIEKPELCLLVNISNTNDTSKVCNVNYLDVRLIGEFLNDELKHKGSTDRESPLINHIGRIQELLGVKLK